MGVMETAELSVTGTPDAVAQVIAQANQLGWPVDMQPVGAGMFRVAARNPTVAWPTPPPPAAVKRPMIPRAVYAVGGTGAAAVLGATIVLLIINPAMLFMVFVLIVLVAIGVANAWDRTKTAVRAAVKIEKG